LLGFMEVMTDGTGIATFSAPLSDGASDGEAITSTATSLVTDDTSEFSACVDAACLDTWTLGHTVTAMDRNSLTWLEPEDVRFAALLHGPGLLEQVDQLQRAAVHARDLEARELDTHVVDADARAGRQEATGKDERQGFHR